MGDVTGSGKMLVRRLQVGSPETEETARKPCRDTKHHTCN
jgi:hypothetical protein